MITVTILPNVHGNPPGKLADAELRFITGPLDGLKLVGFAIWERRTGTGRNVTFPARQYSMNGERRSFALLRPITDTAAQSALRDLILDAYAQYEAQTAEAV
jgi:hypothetical protein